MPKKSRRRSPGESSIEWRKDRKMFCARIVIGYKNTIGKTGEPTRNPVRVSKFCPTKTEALAWLEEQRAKLKRITPAAQTITVAQLIADYCADKTTNRAAKTARDYKLYLERFIQPTLGAVRLRDLEPITIRNLVKSLQDDGTVPGSVERALRYLKYMLNYAVNLELLDRNPAMRISVPKTQRRPLTVWSAEEAMHALEYARTHTHPLRHYLFVALMTALRREEMLGLRWRDIDWHHLERPAKRKGSKPIVYGALIPRQTVVYIGGTWKIQDRTKTEDSSDVLLLEPEILEVLRDRQRVQDQERVNAKSEWRELDLIFTSSIGTPPSESRLLATWREFCDDTKLPPIRLSDLRATWATNAEERGVTGKAIQQQLRHTEYRTTFDRYIRPSQRKRELAALSFEELYGAGGRRWQDEPKQPTKTQKTDAPTRGKNTAPDE
ncbi:MAG: site-specific integrase [Pleurocapsa sp. SU_196_0]|nr:site-specific integrase [Pleurocapsa sp. SU_196_0]